MKDIGRRRLMVGSEGLTARADVQAPIRELGAAHVILFPRNVEGPEPLAESIATRSGLTVRPCPR